MEQEQTTTNPEEMIQEGGEQEVATETQSYPGLEEKYAELLREHEELREKFLRIYADFDNLRKRTLKEKADLLRTASQDTLTALLPVLDDFERAKANAEKADSTEKMSEGVLLVYHKLFSTLKGLGLEPMVTNGEVFDPELHEAVVEIQAPVEDMQGKIVDTIEKGYRLSDKIIRYAKVVVGK